MAKFGPSLLCKLSKQWGLKSSSRNLMNLSRAGPSLNPKLFGMSLKAQNVSRNIGHLGSPSQEVKKTTALGKPIAVRETHPNEVGSPETPGIWFSFEKMTLGTSR